jgi:hypothetical protein
MPVIRTYAQTKFSKWGGNSYGFALEHVEKHEHPPKLSRDEHDFTGLIFDNFRNGVWDE